MKSGLVPTDRIDGNGAHGFSTQNITDKNLLKEFSGLTTVSTLSQVRHCPKISYKIDQRQGKANLVTALFIVLYPDGKAESEDVCGYSSETDNLVPSGTSVNLKVTHYLVRFQTKSPLSNAASVDFFFKRHLLPSTKITYNMFELNDGDSYYEASLKNKHLNQKLPKKQKCPPVSSRINDDIEEHNAVTSLKIESDGSVQCDYTYKKGLLKNGSKQSMNTEK